MNGAYDAALAAYGLGPAASNTSLPDPLASIGFSLGSQLGQLIGGSNPFTQVAASTLLGALGNALQQNVGGDFSQVIKNVGDSVAQSYGDNSLGTSFATTGVSLVSSQLTNELLHAIGVSGFGGQLASVVLTPGVDAVVTYQVQQLFPSLGLQSGGSFSLTNVASFLGQELGQLVVTPETETAVVLSDLGSTAGSALGAYFGVGAAPALGDAAIEAFVGGDYATALLDDVGATFGGPIGAAVGAFVGFVLGALIGDLFGHKKPRIPTATAAVVLQIPAANYALGSTSSANGGDLNFVMQMANTAAATLNGIMYEVVGAQGLVANSTSPTQTYGLTGSQIYVTFSGTQHNENTGDQAINAGVMWAIKQTELIGGNIFEKRAIANSTATDVTSLMADLQIASDYTKYRQSWQSMNQLLAANPNSALTAGWIVTLQRANELNLDGWNTSDFYGGFHGFLSSFGLGAMAAGPHYEDLTFNWDGTNLNVSLPSAIGQGVFSIMPSASADGSSLAIGGFTNGVSNWGYTIRAPGTPLTTTTYTYIYVYGNVIQIPVTTSLGNTYESDAGATAAWTFTDGGSADNVLIGGNGGNTITAGSGYDWIQGGSGTDTLTGGSGYDTIIAGSGSTTIYGGSGGGYFAGGNNIDVVVGGSGASTVAGGTGASAQTIVVAGSGAVTFLASAYSAWDSIEGGSSNTVSFERVGRGVTANLSNHPSWWTDANNNPTASFLYQTDSASPNGQDYSIGTIGVTNLIGSNYNDVLETSAQGGVLEGLGGADQLIGGGGITTASYQHSSSGVYVDLSANPSNLAYDPYFTNLSASWQDIYTTNSSVSTTLSVENDDGARVLRHQTSGTPAVGWQMNTNDFGPNMTPVTPGQQYEVSAYISSSGAQSAYIDVEWFNASDGFIGYSYANPVTLGGGFTSGYASAILNGGFDTAPTGAAFGTIGIVAFANGSQPLNIAIAAPTMTLATAGQQNDPEFFEPSQSWQDRYISQSMSSSTSVEVDGGVRVLRRTTSGTPAAGTQMNLGQTNPAFMIPVVAGQSVNASLYIASTGMSAAGGGIEWINSSGAYVGYTNLASFGPGGSFDSAGVSNAYHVFGTAAAPTGAAYGGLVGLGNASGSGPMSLAVAEPMLQLSTNSSLNTPFTQLAFSGAASGGDANGDTFSNIQNLIGSNYDDELKGLPGSVLNGGAGDDTFDYSGGDNQYIGGDGFDTVDYSLAPVYSGSLGVYVDLSNNAGYWDANGDTYSSIEKVVGTAYSDYIYGAATGTTFDGGGGNDYLYGGAGSDTYIFNNNYGVETITDSNSASNVIQFGAGISFDDLWIGTSGGSSGYLQIGIRGQSGYVQVNGNFGAYPVSGNDIAKTLDLDGAGQVDIGQITYGVGGTDSAETLSGLSNRYNMIFAYGGNDTIYAQSNQFSNYGAVIDGGLGNDTIYASNGDDQYLFERGDGQDTITDTGGQNTVVFGPTVAADDVIYQIVGDDLYIGIRDLNNPNLTASQVSDNMRFIGGGVIYENEDTGATTQNTVDYVIAGGTTVNLLNLNLPWTDITYSGGGGNYLDPIVFDLSGTGLQLTPVANSDIVTETTNGIVTRMGWIGPDNGILAYDRSGDGQINNSADISFIQDTPGATSDLGGLTSWDTNHDGVLNSQDANWGKLLIWVDKNQDGVAEAGEAETLAQAGISSISLTATPTGFDGSDTIDSFVQYTTTFTRSDGTTGTAYNVSLAERFLTASGIENAPDITWDQVTGVQTIGHLLNDPMTALKSLISTYATAGLANATAATAALATIGLKLGNAPVTEAALSKLADVDFSPGQTISASDATLWSDFLNPTKNAALKTAIAAGMSGSDVLSLIKTTTAYPIGTNELTGRGIAQVATRAAEPIVIDFAGTGLSLTDVSNSSVKVDAEHTGVPQQIGWVAPAAGILGYDLNGDGKVDPTSEISFAVDKPGAKTSIQGLAAFDTNADGVIDSQDTSYSKFLIWRDANGNGVSDPGETETLQQAGIASISLKASNTVPSNGDVTTNQVLGQITVKMADGTTRTAYDTALGVDDPSAAQTPTSTGASSSPLQSTPSDTLSTPSAPISTATSTTTSSAASVLTTLGSSASVTASRLGEDGPEGAPSQAVATNASLSDASGWWASGAGAAGSILDGITPLTLAGSSSSSGAGQSLGMVAASQDAASAQRQLLLQQSLVAFQGLGAGSAAIWARQPDSQGAAALSAAAQMEMAKYQALPVAA